MVVTIPIKTTIPTTMVLDFIIKEDITVVVFQQDTMLKEDITVMAFKEDTMVLVFTVLVPQMVVEDITQVAIMEATTVLCSPLIHLDSLFQHHHLHNTLFLQILVKAFMALQPHLSPHLYRYVNCAMILHTHHPLIPNSNI
ncbi:hypothetical protein Pyn_20151 [Prunus yedoensis var. nudiflora]|uniref:Uncharacterized protein n=1 Tax=Prunus yedoensis var. nudiflora TaxID=2094558 RepID=A0A314XN54_PRUYE|nr:hypothetical protein Pyn_20151 [Prunus yedoensis var. nudiflora]